MFRPIRNARYFHKYGSYDGIADAFQSQDKEKFKRLFGTVKSRSLGAKIGNLDRRRDGQDLNWWARRAEQTEWLIELLGLTREDLALEPSEAHLFKFDPFQALPPLDLRTEMPCDLGQFVPLKGSQTFREGCATVEAWLHRGFWQAGLSRNAWLQIEDAFEFQQVAARLLFKFPADVLNIGPLDPDDIPHKERLHNPSPLVLLVEQPLTQHALEKLRYKRPYGRLCIISPRDGHAAKSFEHWHWLRHPDWRSRLLQWIDQRATAYDLNGDLELVSAVHLVDEIDPGERLLVSTCDIYALCHHLNQHPARSILDGTAARDVKTLARRLLALPLKNSDFEHLLEICWRCWDSPWTAPLSRKQWQESARAGADLDRLETLHLLIPVENGYALGEPTLQRFLLRDLVAKDIRQNNPDWHMACYDASRRPIVDAALDTLTLRDLCKAAQSLLGLGDPLDRPAPAVALFLAIGRRLPDNTLIPRGAEAHLRRLAAQVLQQVESEGCHIPWSRPCASQGELLVWITACWAWSERIAAPGEVDPRWSWLFPGWTTSEIQVPSDVLRLTTPLMPGAPQRQAIKTLLRLSPSFWENLEARMAAGHIPAFLSVGLLAHAYSARLSINPFWWRSLIGSAWLEEFVLQHWCSLQPGEESQTMAFQVAAYYWPPLVDFVHQQSDLAWHRVYNQPAWFTRDLSDSAFSPLTSAIVTVMKLEPALAIGSLNKDQLALLCSQPASLPSELRLELLSKMVQVVTDLARQLEFFEGYGAECAAALPPFLSDPVLGPRAASALWAWDHTQAEAILPKLADQSPVDFKLLVLSCPPERVGVVLAILAGRTDLFTREELRAWARARIPHSGAQALKLMEYAN